MIHLLIVITLVVGNFITIDAQNTTFPADFIFGFGSSAYQNEGAWNEDGKGENTWDHFLHTNPDLIDDRSNGDVACDQYHKYKDDVALLKSIGAQTYRMSLSWSRILPDGLVGNINEKGVNYYNNLFDTLIENGIQPMVTLFIWDLPQRLQDLGGWPNPILSDYFEDYARLAFTLFGDRVKQWVTFNEPFGTCYSSYGNYEKAPGINMSGIAEYLCAHTLLHAHAKAYHLYNDTFRAVQNGIVGITLSGGWNEPASDDPADIEAADTANSFQMGWFADPIFNPTGDYPAVMRRNVDANSAAEGRLRSRLPQWDQETVEYIRGTSDFFGLNHYTTQYAIPQNPPEGPNPSWDRDAAVAYYYDPSWPSSGSVWLKVVPFGFRKTLNYIKNKYNNPVVIVTENGFSDHGTVEDDDRINYFYLYLQELLKAIYEDGCNVIGYTAWSFMDNFEWRRGYTERFGIVRVDFDDTNRTRTEKKSAQYFRELLSTRTLPQPTNGKWSF